MIYHVDAWSNLSKSDIEEFSKIDRILLCNILKVPRSVPKESLYLELGITEISMILRMRRLNYFFDVMTRKKTDMLQNFIMVQWHNETAGDWTEIVKEDFKQLEIKDPMKIVRTMTKVQ